MKRAKKILKKIINILVVVSLLLAAPLVSNRLEHEYFHKYIASYVVPLTEGLNRYCTASNIEYKDSVYLVTNRHCCMKNGTEQTLLISSFKDPHTVLFVSPVHDLCIATSRVTSGLSLSESYAIHDKVRVIGHARGRGLQISKGQIHSIPSDHFPWIPLSLFIPIPYLHLTNRAYGGNSGSPVVDRLGRVIGILFAISSDSTSQGMVVPLESLIKALEEAKKK